MWTTDEAGYMARCLKLAALGAGAVAPNPMVGAVLVHDHRIIGEGYHERYGGPHAEVNCIHAVSEADKPLIPASTMYVSLEPCAHTGKTPPCADLIIRERIARVVIGCRDPFPSVDGRGISKLQEAGIVTETGLLEAACMDLNRRFIKFTRKHEPYVILKWAQTSDGVIGSPGRRLLISGDIVNRLVHRWRSEEGGIMVGTRTAALDNPQLTTRLWPGSHPVRLVVDMNLSLPRHLHVFDGRVPTVVFNTVLHDTSGNVQFYQITHDVSLVHQVMNALVQLKISSVLIEGGARILQSFIDEEAWDEARVIVGPTDYGYGGIRAPVLTGHQLQEQQVAGDDRIFYYRRSHG